MRTALLCVIEGFAVAGRAEVVVRRLLVRGVGNLRYAQRCVAFLRCWTGQGDGFVGAGD